MEITEVRIKLMTDPNDRLQAFCSITFDGMFVIRDLKIIQGTRGPFVAMPSRKLTDRGSGCGKKNELRQKYERCDWSNQTRQTKDLDIRPRDRRTGSHELNSKNDGGEEVGVCVEEREFDENYPSSDVNPVLARENGEQTRRLC